MVVVVVVAVVVVGAGGCFVPGLHVHKVVSTPKNHLLPTVYNTYSPKLAFFPVAVAVMLIMHTMVVAMFGFRAVFMRA